MRVNYSDEDVIKGEKAIFLAGPTPRSKDVTSWRKEACDILRDLGFDGVVYDPEYSNMEPRENYEDQAMWERMALTEATVIVFWVPRHLPEMPAFTTNVEFGYWLHTGKAIYGRPDNAEKIKYLDWLYELDYGIKPINDLRELLARAVKKVNDNK